MSDEHSLPVFESFLVRFWQERTSHVWRGKAIRISSQETCDFATWDQAVTFMRRFVPAPPVTPTTDETQAD